MVKDVNPKFYDSNGEAFLELDSFCLKISSERDVMIRKQGKENYSVIGVKSPYGMSMEEKEYYLLHIAYGVKQLELQECRTGSDQQNTY